MERCIPANDTVVERINKTVFCYFVHPLSFHMTEGALVLCVRDILASAQIMEKAAKAPASPCPLIMGVV